MTQPASVEDWQDVEGIEYFVAYLHLLAAEAGAAEHGMGSWRNATIPDFLAAIGTLLAFTQTQIALGNPVFAEPMMTDWWEVACLLSTARHEAPASLPEATTGNLGDAKAVEGLDSLLDYVRWLIGDFRLDAAEVAERTSWNKWDSQGRWAYGVLSNWLGTWAAKLEDAYLKPLPALMIKLRIQRDPVEPVSWRSIAVQLSGARIYE
ncbi:hypothetical protein ABH920_008812 [Catenulispora sp. EB89]|uniref:hypothetical protein n=1 Tax=Catenulispora sp. EB89 TaxID=3156257 RepID=UPI0035114DD1